MYMEFGTWNVTNLCGLGLLKTIARIYIKIWFDGNTGGQIQRGWGHWCRKGYTTFCGNVNNKYYSRSGFSYKRETCCQLILDGLLVKCRMRFLTKGLFMCFFLIANARTEGKSNNTDGQVLWRTTLRIWPVLRSSTRKVLLEDANATVGRYDHFNPRILNKSYTKLIMMISAEQ